MKNKITVILFLILLSAISLQSTVQIYDNNPALYGNRTKWQLGIPAINFKVDAGNSLLNLTQMEIFDKDRYDNGHVMSEKEKGLLSEDDLILDMGVYADVFELGYKNFNLKVSGYGYLHGKLLDKKYTELALYGNETNREYVFKAGDDSRGFAFIKAELGYSYHKPFNLGMIFSSIDEGSVWKDMSELPIYGGINLNLYSPNVYFNMEESTQRFGTMNDSLFYDYYSKYYYSDDDTKGKISFGFGMGINVILPQGQILFSVDDLFAKLNFEDVAGGEYEGEYVDYLLYFHDDEYDPIDNSYENDSLRVSKKSVSLDPTVSLIMYNQIYKNLDLILKYKESSYEYPAGMSGGLGYTPFEFLPLQVLTGYDENIYFSFNSGLQFKHIEYTLGVTFFHGFFNHARGLGFSNMLKIKF